jgi:hypothetical protein
LAIVATQENPQGQLCVLLPAPAGAQLHIEAVVKFNIAAEIM